MSHVLGLHHMTAICGDAQENIDFYAGVLALRLVKVTVNYDDPSAYHLYYGDGAGSPGSLLTFFPYPKGRRAIAGAGAVSRTYLAVPPDSIRFWIERLAHYNVRYDRATLSGKDCLTFEARDGLAMGLVESQLTQAYGRSSGVPEEVAIGPIAGFECEQKFADDTLQLLTGLMGYREGAEGANRRHLIGPDNTWMTIDSDSNYRQSRGGHGGVHHIAFRVAGEREQLELHDQLYEMGINVSPVRDRHYFRSIYFPEPGGVLFEIATNAPGFGVDEDELGTELKLPPQFEQHRDRIERSLPTLVLPNGRLING